MITGLDRFKKKWNLKTDPSIKPGLGAIQTALAELGNPQHGLRAVHIAGSNGKGSTAAFLRSILSEHGLSVGAFFSPAVEDVRDQIQLNGSPVTEEQLDRAMERLTEIRTPLTDFELLTAAAFLVFQDLQPDVAIIEAGMGGRFDSTNVLQPAVCIIPSVSLEHTAFLGNTIAEIAWHKAGIIKAGVPVVAGKLPEEAEAVVRKTASELQAPFYAPEPLTGLQLKMKGEHQLRNAALALKSAALLLGDRLTEKAAFESLMETRLPNRFEEVAPDLIFDGAHNPDSIEKLIRTIQQEYPDRKIRIAMGMLKDKDYVTILRKLEQISESFIFLDFDNPRALPAEKLFQESAAYIKTIQNVYDILPVSEENEVTLVTGSLYLLEMFRKSHENALKRENN